MARKALARRATVGWLAPGRDAYVTRGTLRQLVAAGVPRYWTFHDAPTTVERAPEPFAMKGDDTYAKLWDRFSNHDTVAKMRALLDEYAECGVPRPGGYADVFHARYKSPRVPYSINANLAPLLAGGWQDAISPGVHYGRFYKYDLRSAYLWAGSLGMPDPATYRRSTHIAPDISGVYAVELERPSPGAPFPFNRARRCLATSHEIEIYDLAVSRVISGVRWTRTLDPRPMLDAVRAVSTWKEAGRSYWGRWGQRARVSCHTASGRTWQLPAIGANIPWAHIIISRVKERLWNYSAGAVHVYVDSVITRDAIPTGESVGDWKLEKVYPDGVTIVGPGQYGDRRERRLERMAGVSPFSPLRELRKAKIERLAEINADLLAG